VVMVTSWYSDDETADESLDFGENVKVYHLADSDCDLYEVETIENDQSDTFFTLLVNIQKILTSLLSVLIAYYLIY
jgi:hypothetical protein